MIKPDSPARFAGVLRHHIDVVRQVISCIENGQYCALLGPRFSGKTDLLRSVEKYLVDDATRKHAYIDLRGLEVSTQARFFAGLIKVVSSNADWPPVAASFHEGGPANSLVFRTLLRNLITELNCDLVIIFDHLEAMPRDLLQTLLASLRAAYMDQQTDNFRLITVVSGALSLAEHTVGATSPFRGIAKQVLVTDMTADQSRILLEQQLTLAEIKVSQAGQTYLLAAAGSDLHLIERICQICARVAKKNQQNYLSIRTVKKAVDEFVRIDAAHYEPLVEGVRLVEDNPDLLHSILQLLSYDKVPKRNLSLPLAPDLDTLYLTGLVIPVSAECYQLRNEIYRLYLRSYFNPGRVGNLLTMSGEWDAAINYLEASLKTGNYQYQSDLLAATINAMYASQEIERACYYLNRGLSAVFNIKDTRVWSISHEGKVREPIGKLKTSNSSQLWIDHDQLEARAYGEARAFRGKEIKGYVKRAIPLLIPGDKPIGVVTIFDCVTHEDEFAETRELQLSSYLSQTARAFRDVLNRQNQRELERKRRELAETLSEISAVINGSLDLEKVLRLILEQMERVLPFDTASIQLLNPETNHLDIFASKGFDNPADVEGITFSLDRTYPNVRVWQSKRAKYYGDIRELYPHFSDPVYQAAQIRGWLGVPLIVQDEAIGVITLDSKLADVYSAEHEQIAMTIAAQAALAIKNAHLLKSERHQREVAETLRQVTFIINGSLDLGVVLDQILTELAKVIEYDSTSLRLVQEEKLIVRAIQGFENPDLIMPLVAEIKDNPLFQKIVESRQPVVIPDVKQDVRFRHWTGTANVRSWIGVPLVSRDRVIGQLALDKYQPNFYNDKDGALAFTFAQQAAIAIENAWLYEQMEARTHVLAGLLQGSQALTERISDKPRSVLDKIAEVACKVMNAPCAVVYPYLFDSSSYDVHNVGRYGLMAGDQFSPKKRPRKYGVSLTANIVRQGRRIVANIQTDADQGLREARFIQREGIEAFIGISLKVGRKNVGVLFVNYREPHHFTEEEINTVEILANHAASAILNAHLYQQTSEALRKRIDEMETIQEIDDLITSTLDLPKILDIIIQRASQLIGGAYGHIQLVSEAGDELILTAERGSSSAFIGQRLQFGDGITGMAARNGRTYRIADVQSPEWIEYYHPYLAEMRSVLAVPMHLDGNVVGVINIESPNVGVFNEDDERFLDNLAKHAAIAIQNAKQYEKLQETQDELLAAGAVAWMGLFGSEWSHTVAQKTFSIRTNVAILKEFVNRHEKIDVQIAQEKLAKIDIIAQEVQDVPLVISSPAETEKGSPMVINKFVRKEVEKWCEAHKQIELQFDFSDENCVVCADKTLLKMALQKIVDNAIRHMPKGGTLALESHAQLEGFFTLAIQDSGSGIPDHYKTSFGRRRIPKKEDDSGSGMGALLARFILRKYGGDLKLIWSKAGIGTRLEITLPICRQI